MQFAEELILFDRHGGKIIGFPHSGNPIGYDILIEELFKEKGGIYILPYDRQKFDYQTFIKLSDIKFIEAFTGAL